jgi:hypothetical protein
MPRKIRSRLVFLGGSGDRKIAVRSEWRRPMCAKTPRTIAGSGAIERAYGAAVVKDLIRIADSTVYWAAC